MCVERFLDAVSPDVVACFELELWPNFVRACSRRGIGVCVINGRLSERSFRRYARGGADDAAFYRALMAHALRLARARGLDPARARAIADELSGADG